MANITTRPVTKLGIVGAGSVGTSLAYAAIIRDTAREIAIYDIDAAKAEAEALDLAHGTQFTGASTVTGGGNIEALAGADVIVITAGARQQPGQSRLDLAGTNVRILEKLIPQLMAQAPDAVYIQVTNPADVLAVAAQKIGGLPRNRIFSSGTVLDTSRLRLLLAREAHVLMTSVHATIIGEHGDSEFPVWSNATIGPVPIREWKVSGRQVFTEEFLAAATNEVVNAAYKVIEGKGATNYAIGLAGVRIVEAVLNAENAVLPVAAMLDGEYGISGVALSLPSVVGHNGVYKMLEMPLDGAETKKLMDSAETLRNTLASLGI
ncbi:L-lactate dehydrogenase [Arthrobacter sp. zg-Y40]|uniref:L-lactate dehydrogenase n=1 Tax=unclassified Arthrobacter TaxID=235627 RepID=UPI001D15B427|nr:MULTISPECIES: L-lactate dehydrogenase [unclassified Arthrobacter]MCC3277389.1 L-lactate dehydrogenase [Arthrobacter sp. zg-Y20]MCC3280014.1 L-lactate dehydrogenase [Arthrobacter sp. zg-Y40]MDK1317549.1 L-lactate dehydrogenase [Arthrobacter sp. zg.Y20]MDK1328364.1 L-lactate dehydrogenase [Arthrobacter sp. zg-Y1143]WIB06954.1 L-lactate dehydrogenase [Arthrobacter sp. zg-Y20]